MPIATDIDKETGFRTHDVTGELTPDVLVDVLAGIYARPDYQPGACSLWDFTKAEIREFSPKEIRRIVNFVSGNRGAPPGTCAALVVSKNLDFGLARMYQQMLTAATPVEVSVFRDREEAIAWLTRDRDEWPESKDE